VEACPPLDDEPAGRLAGGRLVVAASTGQRADPRTVTMDRCEATWSGPVAPGPSNPTTGLQLPITRARASATTSDARRRRRGPSNVSAARRRAPRSGGAFRAAAEHAVTARRRPALDHQRLVPAERTPQGASGLVRRVDRRRRRPSGPACLAPDDNPQVPALGTPERPESSFCQV